jgi:hypothetical protein
VFAPSFRLNFTIGILVPPQLALWLRAPNFQISATPSSGIICHAEMISASPCSMGIEVVLLHGIGYRIAV